MKQIKLYDSNGKIFFKINLNPKFSFLDKQCMFQELKGAIDSLNAEQRENLKEFSDTIVNDCIDSKYEQQASEQKG
tara:strand:+ start:284 stop:511 length:228 start_codon:yes stop_codon:yes gene_type:complete